MIKIVELPDENELAIAVIKKILPYGAFCVLVEYNNLEAFLHVSEVAPRWIKNIHEFISEGQQYVVKVHRVDKEKNQVDVSIKRVSEEEKRRKLELVQNTKRAEKLYEVALKASGLKLDPAWRPIIEKEFGDIYFCFKSASDEGEDAFKGLDLPAKLRESIIEIARKNIKKAQVKVDATVTFISYGPNGLEEVKKALHLSDVEVQYLGAPKYRIIITAPEYKSAEKKLHSVLEGIKDFAESKHCDFSFEREK